MLMLMWKTLYAFKRWIKATKVLMKHHAMAHLHPLIISGKQSHNFFITDERKMAQESRKTQQPSNRKYCDKKIHCEKYTWLYNVLEQMKVNKWKPTTELASIEIPCKSRFFVDQEKRKHIKDNHEQLAWRSSAPKMFRRAFHNHDSADPSLP